MNEHDAISEVDTKGAAPASARADALLRQLYESDGQPFVAPVTSATMVQHHVITTADAFAGLDEIFRDLQTRFHNQWNWMDAVFYVECLRSAIEDLTALVRTGAVASHIHTR